MTTSPAVPDPSPDLEPSCFEILNILRSRLLLARTKLVEKIEIAQLDEQGGVSWVEFAPQYHSHLVRSTMSLFPRLAPSAVSMAKRAMFVYILEVLNRAEDDTFILLQRGKSQDNRAQREKNRLARKRARAAKREREREAAKRIVPPAGAEVTKTSAGTTCTSCGRLFNSRKRYSKHACVRKEKKGSKQNLSGSTELESRTSTPTTTNSTGVPPVTGISADSDAPISLETQAVELATVEGELGEYLRWVVREKNAREWLVCEACESPAVGVKIHGNHETCCYLKCEDHFYALNPVSYRFPPSLRSALLASSK
ncbi:hypothetical protein OG21DRAFT_810245 [Imleria badia]|nr:hypothetical protein OG21DRAFT_810245 [Imleria badia]